MTSRLIIVASVFALLASAADAQVPANSIVVPPASVTTMQGPALITGGTSQTQSVMIPGAAVGGLMLNNGNGTNWIMIPGQPSQAVATPR